ncbi:protein 4.1 isoform X2 [Nelusetta ayraudi]|uniref:protein 4.1 isoform X2 n=1 Tax=Nelusetta ayraudi TaxID=303726 RepID=UPI003F71EA5A
MTTDETESRQDKPIKQEEVSHEVALPSPENDKERPANRSSTGRGLSRLFSSFLNSRSQGDADGGEKDGRAEEGAKAPIADPEPELKTEGDAARDQCSEEKKDADGEEVVKDEENSKENQGVGDTKVEEQEEEDKQPSPEDCGIQEEKKTMAEEETKVPRAQRRPKALHIKVSLLDNTEFQCELDKYAKGQELFMKVCDHLNLLEKDYYGVAIWETATLKTWMDLAKDIRRQVKGADYNFTFNVKFYPPDPAHLSEDITRYYLCLQLRKDILQGLLPCSFVTLALLGSYALQSELGEYDSEVHADDYAKEMKMVQGQTKELEDKMTELHKTYRSMSPAQADLMFLDNAKKLSMYGVDLHQAKDLDGVEIMLGVCSNGLMVYKDKLRINRFPWPKVLKVSYKRSSFFIKIRPSEVEQYESAIGFKLPSYKAAKRLWKVCVEHHTFFRLTSTEMATTPRKFLALGSKFRYSGRTQAQSKQASSLIDRPAPLFQRSSSKRNSRSLDGAMALTPDNRSVRPVSAPIIAPWSPQEAAALQLLPIMPQSEKQGASTPREQRCADRKPEEHKKTRSPRPESTPDMKPVARRERRHSHSVNAAAEREKKTKKKAKQLEGETIYIRHSNLMLEDGDKTQTEILRHHSSIRELKRSFMESLPDPQPSEWDKRLQTNSPYRSVSISEQLQPASPVLKTQTITISDVTNSLRECVTHREIPFLHSETKTITYESPQPVDTLAERDSGVLLSAQTITSETVSTTTTTQITKTVKGGISETRIEKRIVITGDTEIDHDKALAQAIKEAKEQHPDMSVTKVVVHQETEISPD